MSVTMNVKQGVTESENDAPVFPQLNKRLGYISRDWVLIEKIYLNVSKLWTQGPDGARDGMRRVTAASYESFCLHIVL